MSCIIATGHAQFSWLSIVFLDANIIMPELQYKHQQCRTRTIGSYFRTVKLMQLYKVILKKEVESR
jgi:hypothetical protein